MKRGKVTKKIYGKEKHKDPFIENWKEANKSPERLYNESMKKLRDLLAKEKK